MFLPPHPIILVTIKVRNNTWWENNDNGHIIL